MTEEHAASVAENAADLDESRHVSSVSNEYMLQAEEVQGELKGERAKLKEAHREEVMRIRERDAAIEALGATNPKLNSNANPNPNPNPKRRISPRITSKRWTSTIN